MTEPNNANEIVAAAEALKAAGKDGTVTIHGWVLEWKKRNGQKSGDYTFIQENAEGAKVHSLIGLKRRLGLEAPARDLPTVREIGYMDAQCALGKYVPYFDLVEGVTSGLDEA